MRKPPYFISALIFAGEMLQSAPNSHGESSQGVWKNYEGTWTPKPFLKVLIFQWIFFGCSQYLMFTSSLRKFLPHQTDFTHLKGKPKSYRTQFSKKTTPATINAVPIALFAVIRSFNSKMPSRTARTMVKGGTVVMMFVDLLCLPVQLNVSKPKKRLHHKEFQVPFSLTYPLHTAYMSTSSLGTWNVRWLQGLFEPAIEYCQILDLSSFDDDICTVKLPLFPYMIWDKLINPIVGCIFHGKSLLTPNSNPHLK